MGEPMIIIGMPREEGILFTPGTRFDYHCAFCNCVVGLALSGQRKLRETKATVACLECGTELAAQHGAQIEAPSPADIRRDMLGESDN